MQPRYDYHSARARKARIARLLGRSWLRIVLVGISLVAAFVLVAVLLQGKPVAWLALIILWLPLTLLAWHEYELKVLPKRSKPTRIDDLLEPTLLGLLPAQVSPKIVAQLVMSTNGGQFYAARFGIGSGFLLQVLSDDPKAMEPVWQEALKIMELTGGQELSSAMVAAALIRTCPNIDQVLAHLQLDKDDILHGVDWQEHIVELIARHRAHRLSGGFGRDWSFGYTPMLSRFGLNITGQIEHDGLLIRDIEGHAQVIQHMIEALAGSGHQNVALVGPLGVGKTTLVNAFAERLMSGASDVPETLRYRQVISLDASTLISNAHGRGQLEDLVNQLLYEAHSAKNIILCLDDAELFFEEGVGSVDLSNILQPILDGGALRMIVTMDEQRLLQISQRNPGLIRALNRISVTAPERHDVLHILQDQLILLEFQNKVTFMYQALVEAYRLSERYTYDQAMPGKAMKLLEAATRFSDHGLVTAKSVQTAIEQTAGVKVAVATDQVERDKLLNLETLIHERMINQTRAVSVVSDALRRARAGVRNLDRPIGTFLFLGPTGVGKTELAKSIAAVYFNGEDKLIRLDLNEYVLQSDVSRLIASGANDPHSLTAQVMKQPFSVILLDEIEKAHPDVLNTLLQLLDEGILRDANNREVSFKDAIIIATSNAGADKIREHIDAGESLEQFEAPFVEQLIEANIFRPEFLNRFDEIVLFRPLNQDELLQVVDILLMGINKNLSLQKVSVAVDEVAKKLLVTKGYDARLGARPMRRIVQRTVENIVAQRMLSGQVAPGSVISISVEDVQKVIGKLPETAKP